MADLNIVNNKVAFVDDAGNVIYNLPNSSGSSAGQLLQIDGAGNSIFSSSEIISTISGAGPGTVEHNLNNSAIFYHTSPDNNFTANFTNMPTTNNRTTSVTLIISQGGGARMAVGVAVDGVSQQENWQNGIIPSGTPNGIDIVSFTFIRVSDTWTVIGSATSYS